jgi:hypothetical protein
MLCIQSFLLYANSNRAASCKIAMPCMSCTSDWFKSVVGPRQYKQVIFQDLCLWRALKLYHVTFSISTCKLLEFFFLNLKNAPYFSGKRPSSNCLVLLWQELKDWVNFHDFGYPFHAVQEHLRWFQLELQSMNRKNRLLVTSELLTFEMLITPASLTPSVGISNCMSVKIGWLTCIYE